MGIINLTPDSFFKNSRSQNEKEILTTCERMIEEGASIIDIGGYSSRPGADFVSEEEEIKRILEPIKSLTEHFSDIVLSVDTFRSNVAKLAIENGASIINDISAGTDDPNMIPAIAELQVPYIMMHKRGNPKTMQQMTEYEDITKEVLDYFITKTIETNRSFIHDVIIDPGFGFAKNTEQNYHLLNTMDTLRIIGKPILAGLSRKKMIQNVIQVDSEDALNGTTSANTIALLKGAHILRVHDVKEAIQCIKIVEMLN